LPQHCDMQCEETLLVLNNTYIALGKDMPRVKPVAFTQEKLSEKQLANINQAKWKIMPLPNMAAGVLTDSQVVIVDPLGNLVLSHQSHNQGASLPMLGKALLADMKKLLKYSRIG